MLAKSAKTSAKSARTMIKRAIILYLNLGALGAVLALLASI
jgi:hypothetical protein